MTDTRQHPFGPKPPDPPERCEWEFFDEEDGENLWLTECDHMYIFPIEITHPEQAEFRFCPACGLRLEAETRPTPPQPERKLHVVK